MQPEITPGPAGPASNATTVIEMWDQLFTPEMIKLIVDNTNLEIEAEVLKLITEEKIETYHKFTDPVEIRAYIGLLYYSGLWKSSDVNDNRLWDKSNGINLYSCTMSRHRFTFLSTCIRFDDRETRNPDDRLAPIRRLWDMFISNCRNCYTASEECTVDEQLLSFRGGCKFRVYMKDKPDKYGLKIISLNDGKTSYMIYAISYLGKNSEINISNESVPEYYFRLVTEPIYNSNRRVKCDNWYTSIPLLEKMLKTPYKIKITGTIRKNKREIPEELKVCPKERPSSKFCFTDTLSLLSYAPKKKKTKKIVLVASSTYQTTEITNGKPKIVLEYNKYKGGTDTFDKLCHSYTVAGKSSRWPLRFFFGILDQAAVNARILQNCYNKNNNINKNVTAISSLEAIYQHLVTPHLQARYQVSSLRKNIKVGIATILKISDSHQNLQKIEYNSKRRCSLCTRKQDVKTKDGCAACRRPACNDHSLHMCTDCLNL